MTDDDLNRGPGRAGDARPKLTMTPSTAAGIIVLAALLLLVLIRRGFVGALGD